MALEPLSPLPAALTAPAPSGRVVAVLESLRACIRDWLNKQTTAERIDFSRRIQRVREVRRELLEEDMARADLAQEVMDRAIAELQATGEPSGADSSAIQQERCPAAEQQAVAIPPRSLSAGSQLVPERGVDPRLADGETS